jgi:chemotaxis response regulator CheB
MIPRRQTIIFVDKSPFGHDLAALLHAESELETLGWETDLDQAIVRIQKVQPPAVIVVAESADSDSGPVAARIQADCPRIPIAVINLETRSVRIYGGEEQIVEDLRTLVSAIEGIGASNEDTCSRAEPTPLA